MKNYSKLSFYRRCFAIILATIMVVSLIPINISASEQPNTGSEPPEKLISEMSFSESDITIIFGDIGVSNDTLVNDVMDGELSYESDDESVVTVDGSGILTTVSTGNAIITVTRGETDLYESATASYSVTVEAAAQEALSWSGVVPSPLKWNDTAIYGNTAVGGSGDGAIVYSSDNTEVVAVDPDTGVLTLKAPGEAVITATKSGGNLYEDISITYTVNVIKADSAELVFDVATPDPIKYGDAFSNPAKGGYSNGTVKYESNNTDIADVDGLGNVTAHKSGTVTITASMAGNDLYNAPKSVQYQLTIGLSAPKNILKFTKTGNQTVAYGDNTYANTVTGGDTSPATYSSSDTSVASVDPYTGAITPHRAGNTIITATTPADDKYEGQSCSYNLEVKHATQEITFEGGSINLPAITYGESYTNKAFAMTEITYSSSDPSVADVDANGSLTIYKSGKVIITATAKKTEQYAEKSASYELTINKAEQTVKFKNTNIDTITFNDNGNIYVNTATTNATSGTAEDRKDIVVTYKVESGSEYIVDGSFNSSTGEFTVKSAGTITVKVSFTSNERYKDTSAVYTLTVEKYAPVIAFDSNQYSTPLMIDTYSAPTAKLSTTFGGSANIIYSVKEDANGVIKSIDSATGAILFNRSIGTVTILATKPGDAGYKEATAVYTLTVTFLNTSDKNYSFAGSTKNASGWFTDSVSVNAVNGYLISTDMLTWSSSLDNYVTEEGTHNRTFYVIENAPNAGIIKYDDTIRLDKSLPSMSIATENQPINNGIYNTNISVKVDVSDAAPSGIGKIEYWVINNDTVETARETIQNTNSQIFTVVGANNNCDNVDIYVRVTDIAGNVTEKAILDLKVDTLKPIINVNFDNNNGNALNGVGYFRDGRTATITFTERSSNFDRDAAEASISIGSSDVSIDRGAMITWNDSTTSASDPDDDTHTAVVTFADDGNYTFSVSYTDRAGNACTEDAVAYDNGTLTPTRFTIDSVTPTGSITVDEETWSELISELTFSRYISGSVYVSADAQDATSPVTIEYYKTSDTTLKTTTELDSVKAWSAFSPFEIRPDEVFVIYVKISDYAGNYIYVSSDGFILDSTAPDILKLTPSKTDMNHNGIPLYKDDVTVTMDITEQPIDTYSGIKEITYVVRSNGVITQSENIMVPAVSDAAYADLLSDFTYSILIDAKLNNSCDVVLTVSVTDNAGNYTEANLNLDIDITAPIIKVTYSDNKPYKLVDGKGYFPSDRIATISITERAGHFDAYTAKNNIKITAVDVIGKTIIEDCSSLIGEWETSGIGESSTHTASIYFNKDANYTLDVSYSDFAGNSNNDVNILDSVSPFAFTVDKTAPVGSVSVKEFGTWTSLIDKLTFGLWSKNTIEVQGTATDATSPIESITYYKSSKTEAMTVEELNAVTTWSKFGGITVPADERFTVYVKFVDYAGNTSYVSTNGIIVDNKNPALESVKPEITIVPEPVSGVYNSDVTVAVSVIDPKYGDTQAYAGLREIRYEVYNMGTLTQSETICSFDIVNPTHEQLIQSWSKENAIIVDHKINNSNDVKIIVYATDNAGNVGTAECSIKIDTTAPTVRVEFNNNTADQSFNDGVYFDANRTATIIVTERNFDPARVETVITNTEGYIPRISGWTTVEGSSNGDNTTHTAYILFDRDGDYTFSISCTDTAANTCADIDYGTSVAPNSFTVDKTAPTIGIVYDNTVAKNGNYYNSVRVATITIDEHNFETSRINIMLAATENGITVTAPTVSNWVTTGDTHTATVMFENDAFYTFDIDYTDKAGNAANGFVEQSFYIDRTVPVLAISGIVDKSANNTDGDIGFVITATDTNIDAFIPTVSAVVKNGTTFVTKQLEIGHITDSGNSRAYTVTNIGTDGIYRINCTLTDKAGNAYSAVILEDANGVAYTEQRSGDDTLITFSVNRDGSTYIVSDNVAKITEQYYVKNIDEDVIITEINANALTKYSVTLNGNELNLGTDYQINEEAENNAWREYTYIIRKNLFETEGEYKLVISSEDEAHNDAFSDVKGATIVFVVDRTAPIVTVSGLLDGGLYQTESQSVTLIPTDNGGQLHSILVRLVDAEGNTLSNLVDLQGEALGEALEKGNGSIYFEMNEGLYQNVEIICSDCSVDKNGDSNIFLRTFTNVSVSSNSFMIFWANSALRWSVIGGTSIAVIGIGTAAVLKKKRRSTK